MNLEKTRKINEIMRTGRRGMSLITQIANSKANKLEGTDLTLTGENKAIENILWTSDWKRLRLKMGKLLSKEGKGAYAIIPFNGSYYIDVIKVTTYELIGVHEQCITGITEKNQNYEGEDYSVFISYKFGLNKTPILTTYIETVVDDYGNTNTVILDEIKFNTDFLPVQFMFNNSEGLSDVSYASLDEDIIKLDFYDSKLRAEWERTRTLLRANENFTDIDIKDETNKIDNGEGPSAETSFDAKLGSGLEFQQATIGTTVLQQQILFIEDDIKRKVGIERDATATGSNKHNLEIVTREQFVLETLLSQKNLRQKDYQNLFDKLAKLTGTEQIQVTVNLSPIDEAKFKLLEVMVMQDEMAATNKMSQVTANNDKGDEDE